MGGRGNTNLFHTCSGALHLDTAGAQEGKEGTLTSRRQQRDDAIQAAMILIVFLAVIYAIVNATINGVHH